VTARVSSKSRRFHRVLELVETSYPPAGVTVRSVVASISVIAVRAFGPVDTRILVNPVFVGPVHVADLKSSFQCAQGL
jgi:hypothetical protein